MNLVIRSLTPADAPRVASWLASQPTEYVEHFHPFAFDEPTLRRILHAVREDVYLGFFNQDQPFALMLLRGWDEGYTVPMFGGCVDVGYQRRGWGLVGLRLAIQIARERRSTQVMLKVHPKNKGARSLYHLVGFEQIGVEHRTGNLICRVDLE